MVLQTKSMMGVGICCVGMTLASYGAAQAYPQVNPNADPRGASKSAYPQSGQSQPAQPAPGYYSQTPAQGYGQTPPTYRQPQQPQTWAPSPPVAPSAGTSPGYILAPPVLPHRDGVELPQGYVLRSHRNGALMTGGGLTFGAAYAGGLIYGIGKSFDNGTGWLAVPLIGPWVAITSRDFKCKSGSSVSQKEIDGCVNGALNEVTSITFLAMMGIGQVVGATLFFVGVGDRTDEWVRADIADVEVSADAGTMGDAGYGLRLRGAF